MLRLFLLAVLVVISMAAIASPVAACSCGADTRSLTWQAKHADAIFTGTVEAIEPVAPLDGAARGSLVRFAVDRSWVGVDTPSAVLLGDAGG